MPAQSPAQLNALVSLLDDPEPFVQRSVRSRLIELGDHAVPALRRMIREGSGGPGEFAVDSARAVLRAMSLSRFRMEIDRLAGNPDAGADIDLEQGAFAVARLGYPEFQADQYTQQLETMASALRARIRAATNGLIIIREFNEYLVEELGFRGCTQENYYDPDNSYLNRVLERRIGIPLSLSTVYLLLAGRLGVPLHGIGFPAHFLLKFESPTQEFFIDPFNGGMILSYNDCRRMLKATGADYQSHYFEPISNRMAVIRMMRNLAEIFRAEETELTVELENAIAAITPSSYD